LFAIAGLKPRQGRRRRAVKNISDDPQKTRGANDARRYQLAQANKLIRLYELGQLPLELMREMDKLRQRPDNQEP
jgi:hypothetical protein